ncbi:MAG: hypothetical protein Q4B70_16785, partial [Lachnospiraceae bacterium]|nr:hypothetical protein [Lachnospiraceae bacterium]
KAEIANGNLTYYFKKKSDIVHAIVSNILEKCDQEAHILLKSNSPSYHIACLGSFLVMLTVCEDPQIGRMINDIYEDLDSRFLVSIYLERYYEGYFYVEPKQILLTEKQAHSLMTADAHAKFGILLDLLQRTTYTPSLNEILDMAETDFLLTSRICSIEDEKALEAIQLSKAILEKRNYKGVVLEF